MPGRSKTRLSDVDALIQKAHQLDDDLHAPAPEGVLSVESTLKHMSDEIDDPMVCAGKKARRVNPRLLPGGGLRAS